MSQTFNRALAAQAAAGAATTAVAGIVGEVHGSNNALRSVKVVPPSGASTVAGHAANNVTIEVGRIRAGLRVAVASLTTTVGNDLVALTPKTVPVTAAVPTALALGDVLDVKLTQAGAGVAVPADILAVIEVQ